jgi:hypothetical protein
MKIKIFADLDEFTAYMYAEYDKLDRVHDCMTVWSYKRKLRALDRIWREGFRKLSPGAYDGDTEPTVTVTTENDEKKETATNETEKTDKQPAEAEAQDGQPAAETGSAETEQPAAEKNQGAEKESEPVQERIPESQ